MLVEAKGSIWNLTYNDYWKVIPTNGSVNSKGNLAIMGKGVALQAAKLFPSLRKDLATSLKEIGLCSLLYVDEKLVIFPTKFAWYEHSSLSLISRSSSQLANLIVNSGMKVVMPRVGCGLGGLPWVKVRPILINHFGPSLENEVVVLEYEQEEG